MISQRCFNSCAKMLAMGFFIVAVVVPGSLCLAGWVRKERAQESARFPLGQRGICTSVHQICQCWWKCAPFQMTSRCLGKVNRAMDSSATKVFLFLKKMYNADYEDLVGWVFQEQVWRTESCVWINMCVKYLYNEMPYKYSVLDCIYKCMRQYQRFMAFWGPRPACILL